MTISDNDTLTGTVYDDYLNGGDGNDVLVGNTGSDIFVGGKAILMCKSQQVEN